MAILRHTLMTGFMVTLICSLGACGSGIEGDTGEGAVDTEATNPNGEDTTSTVDPPPDLSDHNDPPGPLNDATSADDDAEEVGPDVVEPEDDAGELVDEDAVPEGDVPSGGTGNPFVDCVTDWNTTCVEGVDDCMVSETCPPHMGCLAACEDSACATGCVDGANDADAATLQGLITCAAFGGCFGLGTGPACGDGVCDESEDMAGCPEDCAAPPDTDCLKDNCDLGTCLDNPGCVAMIDCMSACGDLECVAVCTVDAPFGAEEMLAETTLCGLEAGCFGPPPEPEDCLANNCDVGNCQDFEECAIAFECMASCGDDAACANACIGTTSPTFQPPLDNLLTCGIDAGCYAPFCGDGICGPDEAFETCPDDCLDQAVFYGVLVQDSWDGVCNPDYNSSGADIGAVELLSCANGDPGSCETVAWFQNVSAQIGTEGDCTNDFTSPEQAAGPCGCALDEWVSLQGGWLAGDFGDAEIVTGLLVRVYEYGTSSNGTEDPYTVSLINDPSCMEDPSVEGCTTFLGTAVDIADFVVPAP
jgi:hypothetical protein